VQFGSDGASFFLRIDFHPGYEQERARMEARLTAQPAGSSRNSQLTVSFSEGAAHAKEMTLAAAPAADSHPVECALARILEVRIALASLGVSNGEGLRFQLSLWQDGLPIDAAPQQGWITLRTTDPAQMAG
jgi:hypothetical protein